MISNGWKQKKKNKKFWLHYLIKDELGKKIYNSLLQNNKLKDLENELAKRKSIYQIINLI